MCARRDAAALRWCRDDCTTLACTLACRAAGKSSTEVEGGLSNGKTRSSVTAAPRHLLETETRGRPSPLASCEAPRHPALRVDGGGGLRMAHQPQHAERCRRPPSGCVTDPRGETKPATLRPRRIASLMRLGRGKRSFSFVPGRSSRGLPTHPCRDRREAPTDRSPCSTKPAMPPWQISSITATAATSVGSVDASSHGFSAHSEPPPDRSGCEGIEGRYQPQRQGEISSRQRLEQQKLNAEQAAASGDMQNSASNRMGKTCNATLHSRTH